MTGPTDLPMRPGPPPNPETRPFWDGLVDDVVRVQRCESCRTAQLYPRVRCRSCWSASLVWEDASGDGAIWTWTVVHRTGHPAWQAETPYAVVIVELAEGPRLTTRWDGDLALLAVGRGVRVGAREQDGYRVVVATPVEAAR